MVKKGYNRIELEDGTILMDFTDTTATANDVLEGKTFYDKDGNLMEGVYPTIPSTQITMKTPTKVDDMYTPPVGTDGFRRWDIDVTKSEIDKVIDEDETKIVFTTGILKLDGIVDFEPGDFWYGNYLGSASNQVKYFTSDGEYHVVTDLINPKVDFRIEKIYTFSPIGVTSTEHSFSDAEWTKILRSESLLITTQNITDGPITNMNAGTDLGAWSFCRCRFGKTTYSITKDFVEFNSNKTKSSSDSLHVTVDYPNKKVKYSKTNTAISSTSPTMYIYGIMPYHETYGKWF